MLMNLHDLYALRVSGIEHGRKMSCVDDRVRHSELFKERKTNRKTVVTAIARELAGFVWAIAREVKPL